jgi:F-type H+-transporting ATPase subunit delta
LSGNIVARRYAGALFAFGRKAGLPELEKIAVDLDALREMVKASVKLFKFYQSPVFSVEDKDRITSSLLSELKAGAHTRNFCRLLARKGRLAQLPAIADCFDRLMDEEKGVIRGELVTAVVLDEGRRAEVLKQLRKQAGRELALTYSVDPDILGGVLLKVGDKVLDASLRVQLSILKEQIKRGV